MIVCSESGPMKIEFIKYRLDFKFTAGTSRGTMTSKDSWFVKLFHPDNSQIFGMGECGPLNGLSPDLSNDINTAISECINEVSEMDKPDKIDVFKLIPSNFPALRFAMETAVLDLQNEGKRIIYENGFSKSDLDIPINGLVWMGKKELMLERIHQKISEGFNCIKIKIGAINFEDELDLLKYIRSRYSATDITLRLDANGAFHPEDALMILEQLSNFDIHSIEQPIKAGDWKAMEHICDQSPIPIALDEELIGIDNPEIKEQLLARISPSYIILKPTLVGGLQKSLEWIKMAENQGVGWWITSALESNIGLNAIAQFAAEFPIQIPQGLGTGELYWNNINSPLTIKNGALSYTKSKEWELSGF